MIYSYKKNRRSKINNKLNKRNIKAKRSRRVSKRNIKGGNKRVSKRNIKMKGGGSVKAEFGTKEDGKLIQWKKGYRILKSIKITHASNPFVDFPEKITEGDYLLWDRSPSPYNRVKVTKFPFSGSDKPGKEARGLLYLPFEEGDDTKEARWSNSRPIKLDFNHLPDTGVKKITYGMDEYADLAELDKRLCGEAHCFEPTLESESEDED